MRSFTRVARRIEPAAESLRSEQDLAEAYRRYGGELFGYALNSLGDRALAEDVVQETFVRAWRSSARFDRARGSLRTWLYAITRHALADLVRRDRGQRRDDAELAAAGPESMDPVEQLLAGLEMQEALQRLSPEHRHVIVEVHYHRRTCAEVATELDVPAATIRSRLYYGVRALRLILEENGWLA